MTAALQRIITKRSLDCRPGAGRTPRSTRYPNWPDNGGVTTPSPDNQTPRTPGSSQRQHILSVALSLMAQSGVDGTSMRDLATATGLNVASLYHYFPSKRDLLVAVLDVHGFVDNLAAARAPVAGPGPGVGSGRPAHRHPHAPCWRWRTSSASCWARSCGATRRPTPSGVELFAATQDSLERWLAETEPSICDPASAAGHGPDAPGHGGGDVLRARRRRAQRTG